MPINDFDNAGAGDALRAFIRDNKHIMLGGAGLGGLYGAITAPKGKLLRGALRGATIGGAAGTGLGLGANATAYTIDSDRTPITGLGAAGGGLLSALLTKRVLDEYAPMQKDSKQKDTTMKKAELDSALVGGLSGALQGALPGAGIGGLYGALSGAYQAPKGNKLRAALSGAGRGAAGGGLIGAGLGGGLGAGFGAALPTGALSAMLSGDYTQQRAIDQQVERNPGAFLRNLAVLGVGGGALGAYGGNAARKKLVGPPPKKNDTEENEESSMEENKKAASENLSLAARAAALSVKLAEEEAKKEEPKAESGDDDAKTRRRGAAKARAKDLLNTSSFGGGVGDYFFPGMWGGHRAGRATQISQALGQKPSFNLRYPQTSSLLSALGGGLGGAALGGLGGAALGSLSNGVNGASGGAALGALLGGGLGTVAGPFVASGYRRGEMDDVRNSLEDELANNGGANIKPVSPNFGALSSILLPFSGAHRAGQADAYQALKNNERYAPSTGRNLAYMADIGSGLLGPFGAPVPLVRGWAQNFNARGRTAESKPRQAERYGLNEFAPRDPDADLQALPKAASLRKTAKVYEAAEPVDGMQPKETYESHKKCTPGEFGMNKEGAFEFGIKVALDLPMGFKGTDLIAPALGAGVGALGGAVLGKKKEKLRSALIGAGLGAGAGGLAEHFAPGLGLGAKYVGQDIGAHLTGNAGTWRKGFQDLGRAPEIIAERFRRGPLTGLDAVGKAWHGR